MGSPIPNQASRVEALLGKVEEQIDRLEHIIRRLPPGCSRWTPQLPRESFPAPRCLGEVVGHLLQCLAGFLAVLQRVHPNELVHFSRLRELPVNHACEQYEALQRIETYREHIREGFARLSDDDLVRNVSTVFVREGESVLTLLLGNFEHLVNHKHELFSYAKLMGVPLTSRDLYVFRGERGPVARTSNS